MRNKRGFKSIVETIKRYEEEVAVVSQSSILNKQTGKFEKNRTENVRKLALFKKNDGYKITKGGGVVDASIKLYSTFFLKSDDNGADIPDIVIHDKQRYKIISCEKRVECNPTVYISFGVHVDD